MRKVLALAAAGLITLAASSAMSATAYINLYSDDNQVAAAANTGIPRKMTGDATAGFKVEPRRVVTAARICCCRPGPEPSTGRSGPCLNAGIRG